MPALRRFAAFTFATLAVAVGARPAGAVTFGAIGGMQTYTVPSTGFYTIVAAGGAGGSRYVQPGSTGGAGARVANTYAFAGGQTLNLFVGERGGTAAYQGGGGGGTFVTDGPTLLLVAGGGGGASTVSPGNPGRTGPSGSGLGGASTTSAAGGGGGGYLGNGATPPSFNGYFGGGGGSGFPSLAGGPAGAQDVGKGGYGGGGGAGVSGPGGGGGYTGGDAAPDIGVGGDGGTSYSSNGHFAVRGANAGDGTVSIQPVALTPFRTRGLFTSGRPIAGTLDVDAIAGLLLGASLEANGVTFDTVDANDLVRGSARVLLSSSTARGASLELFFDGTDLVDFAGDAALRGTFAYDGTIDTFDGASVTLVPEPATAVLLAAPATLLLIRRRR